ncbi:hypothetical protein [Phytohabitans rumicis]|uniref:hypothetical protein n=1 Tax=Phytohabitans rumicis TaxID=1076125 RepID=UPI00156510F5|nr:hypothetical protein [Phytohabitans rumicis]
MSTRQPAVAGPRRTRTPPPAVFLAGLVAALAAGCGGRGGEGLTHRRAALPLDAYFLRARKAGH